ncbi:ATP-binding protein [Streptomyces sp. NPDC008150]|uniref:ATP-binding protein n=1 Tax=Streptomyces sp. NPDC008150 TaxID=3364816 RepID=UPI0036E6823A
MTDHEYAGTGLRSVMPFEAAPQEVRLLRRAASAQLCQWGAMAAVDEAELLVTELATNVIKHVGEGASATLILELRRGRLRVEVHDKSRKAPSPVSASCDDECGRGLHLLAALAVDWGTVFSAAGKSVWCEVAVRPEAACRRIERARGALERYEKEHPAVAVRGRSGALLLEESAVELIADLLHWSAARGQDPDDMLDRAQAHFEAEGSAAA